MTLTAQRRDEVGCMCWSEIDLKAALWTLPPGRVKNAKGHEVPLSPEALEVLAGLPRIGEVFVITADGRVPARGYTYGKRRLDALLPADMPHWVLHDLRRTAASGMARLGISLPAAEKVLNHSSGSFRGVVAVYQRHDFAKEKREALEAWGGHVRALVRSPVAAEGRAR